MPEIVQLNAFILGLVIAINLMVAILLLMRDLQNPIHRSFFVFVILVTVWVVVRFIDNLYVFYHPGISLWAQLAILAPLFIPFFFYRLITNFTGDWKQISAVQKIIFLIPAIIMSAFLFTPYNVASYDNNQFKPSSLYIWFSVYFILLISFSLGILWRKRVAMAEWQGAQALNIFWGSLLTASFGIIFSAILPLLSYDRLYYLGSMSSAFSQSWFS